MNLRRSTLIATLGIVLAVVVPLSATALPEDPPPLPPENLEGEYDEDTEVFTLSWEPPPQLEEEAVTYNVYRNGELMDQTSSLSYSELLDIDTLTGEVYAYHVTTLQSMPEQESVPSNPFVVADSPICRIVRVHPDLSKMPPVGVSIDEGCIRGLEQTIDGILDKVPFLRRPPSPIDENLLNE